MTASTNRTRESEAYLNRLIGRSQRRTGARLPASFARGTENKVGPLARLIQGGRGGEVRLKLYVSMVLLAGSRAEHREYGPNVIFDVSSTTWAHILALPDPSRRGARRIADAQGGLASEQLITVERRPGQAPKITLRHASGSGDPFADPGTPYIRIPLGLWENRWIWYLSGKELAILIALIDLCRGAGRDGRSRPQPLSGIDSTRYGLSEDTWRVAGAALESYGLLETAIDTVRFDLETPRRRKSYNLLIDALEKEPVGRSVTTSPS